MKVKASMVHIGTDGKPALKEITTEQIRLGERSVMSIDGSTTNTGVSILRENDGALFYSMAFTRDREESPVQYKVRLKREIYKILSSNRSIEKVFYEEPFIGYAVAAQSLMMLRTFVEEIIVEYEPEFNHIKHSEINNLRWKKLFLAPDKVPQGTELQKKAVKNKLVGHIPFLATLTEDEHDSISMGFVACTQISRGLEDELESKKKTRAFKYNIEFIGAEDDQGMLMELHNTYSGPEKLLENGITLIEIKGTQNFDKKIYENMGGEDKVIIAKFSSNHHGNLILEHRIGHLAATFPYLYGVVWRKSRKR